MEEVKRGLGEELLRVEAEQSGFEAWELEGEEEVVGVDDHAGVAVVA